MKKKLLNSKRFPLIKIIVILIFSARIGFAQNLDSLFSAFVNLKSRARLTKPGKVLSITVNYKKCGLGLITSIQNNLSKFSAGKQALIKKLLLRPSLQTSIVSPKGLFRIHYDTTGANKPGFSVTKFAVVLDSVYDFEVNKLKYPKPPSDGTEGGDSLYDFYIEDLPAGLYGATTPENSIGNQRYTAYTEIDNDYLAKENYYSTGLNGAKVTAAHEYHHAIQIGDYINRYSSDGFYYEITSTAMEEFTFDYVNDYYYYIDSYFRHPDYSLSQNDGYNLAILNIFLQKRFDFDLLKRIWELMVKHRAIEAISLAVAERGSTIGKELNEFGLWCYFTSYRSLPDNSFFDYDEAIHYPKISFSTKIKFTPPKIGISLNTHPMSNNFILFPDESRGGVDSLVSIITNSDVFNGVNDPNSINLVKYTISSANSPNAFKINDYYYYELNSSNNELFTVANIFNNAPTGDSKKITELNFAYPQPFNYSKDEFLFIPAPLNSQSEAILNIYSPSMRLIYSKNHYVYNFNKIIVKWDAKDNNGNKLPSGVYIFVVKSGNSIKKGKLVILNE